MTCIDINCPQTPTRVGKTTQQKRHLTKDALKNGGPDRTWTCDLPRVRRTLYQLSYRSLNSTSNYLYKITKISRRLNFILLEPTFYRRRKYLPIRRLLLLLHWEWCVSIPPLQAPILLLPLPGFSTKCSYISHTPFHPAEQSPLTLVRVIPRHAKCAK